MNLLITGAFSCTEEQLKIIEDMGNNIVFMQQEKDELPCSYSWVEGIIGNGIFLHHPIEKFTSLKFVQLTSAGFDRVPMEYVKNNGICIYNAKGVYSIPMAEFAISSVLQIYKSAEFFSKNKKLHKWEKNREVLELFGKTVAIIGCGNVGSECASRFTAFGCKVLGVDLYPRTDKRYEFIFPLERLNDALSAADIVILTLPLSNDTRGLFDRKVFMTMKRGAVLINISRGGVVNTTDLIDSLSCGTLSAAALDVFEEEPLSADNTLWDMENVIITPHNSFVGEGNNERLFDVIVKNLNGGELS